MSERFCADLVRPRRVTPCDLDMQIDESDQVQNAEPQDAVAVLQRSENGLEQCEIVSDIDSNASKLQKTIL